MTTEQTPLLAGSSSSSNGNGTTVATTNTNSNENQGDDPRMGLHLFLEAKTPAGAIYEGCMIALILVNVIAFVLGSLFVEEYNTDAIWAQRGVMCGNLCDSLLFGNYADNGLQGLGLGATSVLEIVTVLVFSVEYLLRLYVADLENPEKYAGFWGRLRWIPTFFSLVDLASTVPFYIDAFVLRHTDLVASSFLRMFRLLRMMRAHGRYDSALGLVDDAILDQAGILLTALFVGVTTWIGVSSLYYLAERRNPDMIYCPDCETADCVIDDWGSVQCPEGCDGCYNLYESIPMASYYALLNLFGEFPHVDTHSVFGKVVGVFTAVVAVAVFALPVGIIGNGLEDAIEKRRGEHETGPIQEEGGMTAGYAASGDSLRARMYNLLHAQSVRGAVLLDELIDSLIVVTVIAFMVDTFVGVPGSLQTFLDWFELFSVSVFTIEYCCRVYAAKEDPKYAGPGGRVKFMWTFLAMVDLLSFLPYWMEVALTGGTGVSGAADRTTLSNVIKSLRLLRILRFERYTHAFLTFDDVVSRNLDVLTITAFAALLIWIFFATCLYFSERDSHDEEMRENYKTIPHSMWITLLNLSGESPLAQYSVWGKVVTGILGLFATGIFGIPIGLMGVGFEEIMAEENQDNEEELRVVERSIEPISTGSEFEQNVYRFVNGLGTLLSKQFELLVYGLIIVSVAVGAWQTVEGHEDDFRQVEVFAVVVFTLEYLLRLIGARADPNFGQLGPITSRLRFMVSFYAIVDVLAIVPFYLAAALPNSIVNDYDEYLRMLRILRLLKLDKYIPSITLIDDVIRLKFNSLRVAFYAAATLWILFSAALYVTEYRDNDDPIDPVPLYGCYENCTMTSRFSNIFESAIYTGIHLTGDYPIITYDWPARFINFFMVIAAVGVVSIPSGIIAGGFIQVVQSKQKRKNGEEVGVAGDDWYEIRYRELEGVDPPPSGCGSTIDRWQVSVNEFLNGKDMGDGGQPVYSGFSKFVRMFIFTVIILNLLAVLLESDPQIDKAVGNEPGNLFDTFEFFSVMVFATEYVLRLFCAPKNREALYSSMTYATTFFGIVDFLSTAPWFIEKALIVSGYLDETGDNARIFRIFRIFRILQLEDFVVAFSKLDNVFRASQDVLKATGLMATIVWVGCGALFFIFEVNNPNWRSCDESIPVHSDDPSNPGCYDFASTAACNAAYPGMCTQSAFSNMPNSLFYTAVFLGGEWGVVDFTWPGRIVCLFLCVVGIGLYSIPIGTLFDSFGAVLGIGGDDEDDEEEAEEGSP